MAAPLLQQFVPVDNATGVAVTSNIGLGFNEGVRAGSGYLRIYKSDGTLFHSIAITDTSQVTFSTTQPSKVMINPNVDLLAGTGYYILIDAGAIEDLTGEDYAGISSPTALNFTTAGSAPGDTNAPLLNTTSPADNATGVSVGSNLVLTFNEAVKAGLGNIEIRNISGGTIAKTIAITDATQATFSGSQLTINPTTDLAAGTGYYVTFASGVVRDLANNNFAGISSSTALNFTTVAAPPGDTTAPLLTSTSPTDNATNVNPATNIVLTFNEAVKAGSGTIDIYNIYTGVAFLSISVTDTSQVSFSGNQVTINPTIALLQSNPFYVTFGSGVILDNAGNAFPGISSPAAFNFTTGDTLAPSLLSTSPADNASNVGDGANLVLTFNEAVKAGTGNVEIHKVSDNSIVKSIAVTDTGQVSFSGISMTIDPTTDLPEGASYYVTLGSGVVRDLSNNAFAGISSPTAFNFTVPIDPNDTLIGTPESDVIDGEDGNDTLNGRAGDDTLIGGTGDDTYIIENYEGGETSILLYTEPVDGSVGEIWSLYPADNWWVDAFDQTGDDIIDEVWFRYFGLGESAHLGFSTAQLGSNLAPGTYTDTRRIIIPSPGHPGLEASSSRWGSNSPTGTFTIGAIQFDYTDPYHPVVVTASIRFEQHSEDPEWSVLFGIINYNYAPAGPVTIDEVVEDANAGNDTVLAVISYALTANVENLTLTGNDAIDATGNGLNNVITGNSGNNVLDGGGGADTMTGGLGDDTYVVDNAGDDIVESPGEGTDTVQSSVTHALDANVENLTLTGGASINGSGNALDNLLTGNTGSNVLSGDTGNDTYVLGAGDSVVENSGAGTDRVESSVAHTLAANVENLTLTGTGNINGTGNTLDNILIGSQMLPGGGGQNILTGGSGNDTLNGRSGLDTLIGGLGNDTYIIDNFEGGQTSILMQSAPGDWIGGGQTFSLIPSDADDLTVNIYDGTGDGIPDRLDFSYFDSSNWWFITFTTGGLGTNLVPGTYLEANRGGSIGHPGLEVVGNGRGSNATFGSFTVTEAVFNYGGPSPVLVSLSISFEQHSESPASPPLFGIINYNYAPAGPAVLDTIVENASEGTDTVQAGVSYTLGANLENLVLKIGSENLNGTGNALNNTLTGNDGDNILDGSAGADTMAGGYGDDTYIIDNAADEVVESALWFDNIDTVKSSVTHALDPSVEDLILTGSANVNGTGNELNNTLTGNTGANVLSGGLGDDTYVLGSGDTIVENPGEGNDTVESALTYTLGSNLENLTLTGSGNINGTGNNLNNTLTGNAGVNVLSGGTGDDTYALSGLEDSIVENLGEGIDTVLSWNSYMLGANVENLTLLGYDYLNGTGNALNNVITGNNYNNILDGGAGADTMIDSYGNDTYVVDDPGDIAVETHYGYGIDTVQSSITRVLDDNIENLTLTGNANINGTGNQLDNNVTGNTGSNVLSGGLGFDSLLGGGGNDTFNVMPGAGSDSVGDFSAGAGVGDVVVLDGFSLGSFAVVQSAMTQNGGNTILNLGNGQTLTFLNVAKSAFAADDFTFLNVQGPPPPSGPPPFTLPVSAPFTSTVSGTRRADILTGNNGDNCLDGGRGNDTMRGLGGDDTYLVDAPGDVVVEASGPSIDTVISSASSYALGDNVENLTLTGTNNHTAIGNGLNNLIIASNRPDTINGGAGNDIIRAGTGACVLTGGAGNDIFDFDVAGSLKTITDFHAGEDLVDLRTLLTWYGGSNPVGDSVIAVTATAGGVMVAVKATAGGSLQNLVKLTGISVGDVDVGGDILWDA